MEQQRVCDPRHSNKNANIRAWLSRIRAWRKAARKRHPVGFTLIELLLAMMITGTLAGLAMPKLHNVIEKARVAKAIGDLKALSTDISSMEPLPNSLADAGRGGFFDPWGNPYQYMKLGGAKTKGAARKDKFLVPLNTDFDLYSMGPDGVSFPALTAKPSKDDIIRANDGGYVGPASSY